jgi:hypothetical protein
MSLHTRRGVSAGQRRWPRECARSTVGHHGNGCLLRPPPIGCLEVAYPSLSIFNVLLNPWVSTTPRRSSFKQVRGASGAGACRQQLLAVVEIHIIDTSFHSDLACLRISANRSSSNGRSPEVEYISGFLGSRLYFRQPSGPFISNRVAVRRDDSAGGVNRIADQIDSAVHWRRLDSNAVSPSP